MQIPPLTIEFVLLQISVAFSPGLIIALVVNESVQKGRINGLQVAYGAATGAIGITVITATVITYIISLIPEILTFIYIFGIIYIIYKGIKTLLDEDEATVFFSLIFLGVITILINLFADISYALLSSYLFNNSSLIVKRYINIISGVCLIGVGIYLFFSRFF